MQQNPHKKLPFVTAKDDNKSLFHFMANNPNSNPKLKFNDYIIYRNYKQNKI